MVKLIENKKLVMILLLVLLLLVNLPILNLPIFWDGVYWVNSAEWMARNNLNPMLPGIYTSGGLDVGHPPLVYFSLASSFLLFGASPFTAHIVMLFFAFLTLYFTYLLGSYIYGARAGFFASLLLLFSPLFLAQSGAVSLDMGVAAFTVMAIYWALKSNKIFYWISGSLLVLSKEAGSLVIGAVFIYIFIRDYKKPRRELIKNLAISLVPVVFYIAWMGVHWVVQHQFVHPALLSSVSPLMVLRFINRGRLFFFNEYNWVLSLLVLVSMCQLKHLKKLLTIKNIFLQLITITGIFIIVTLLFKLFFAYEPLLQSLVNLAAKSFRINEKDFHGILISVYDSRIVFALLIALVIFLWKGLTFEMFKKKETYPIFITILIYCLIFSWAVFMPRYFLPIYPLFYIIGGKALSKLFKKKAYFILLAILVFFIIQGYGSSSEPKGYILEKNMEYVDSVKTHQLMAEYIENNFPEATIATYRFMTTELRYPHLGYVKQTINPIDFEHYNPKDQKTNFALKTDDWYYYQCYLKNQCDPSTQIPCDPATQVLGRGGDIRTYDTRYKEYITSEDFDLFYYSPQSSESLNITNFIKDFNLTLIKKFKKNGKYSELYATKQFLSKIRK